MNRMKKALAMILALAMALCAGAVPAAAEEEPDVVGAVQGEAYINEFFDLAFTLGDGWTFYTEEQLLELGGLTVDQLEGTDAQEYVRQFVESDQGSYVMAAYAPDGLKNVNLVVQDLSQDGAVTPLLTDEMVAAAAFGEEGMKVFQSMGLEDLTIEQNRVELAGAEHPGARISYNGASMGIDAQVYQQSATFVRGRPGRGRVLLLPAGGSGGDGARRIGLRSRRRERVHQRAVRPAMRAAGGLEL